MMATAAPAPAPSEPAKDVVAGGSKEDGKAKDRKRIELRRRNEDAWAAGPQDTPKTLDSSLKRNTAFIKKLRASMGADNREALLKEVQTVSLEKYLEEIVQAVGEGLIKAKMGQDVWAAVEVISALHARFSHLFTRPLISNLHTALSPPSKSALASLPTETREREESARVVRQRTLLRVLAELWLVGIARGTADSESADGAAEKGKADKGAPSGKKGGECIVYAVLKDLLSTDREHVNVPILLSFCKNYGSTFIAAPPASTEGGHTTESTGTEEFPALGEEPDEALVPKELRARFRSLATTYFETLSRRLVREHHRLQEQDRRNYDAYVKSGEIFEDRQQNYERMTKAYEKLLASCQSLSDMLSVPMPTLTDSSAASQGTLIIDSKNSLLGGGEEVDYTGGVWEDEDTRRFYEELVDLRDLVPGVMLFQATGGNDPIKEKEKEEKEKEKEKEEKEKEKEKEKNKEGAEEKEELKEAQRAAEADKMDVDDAAAPAPGSGLASPKSDGDDLPPTERPEDSSGQAEEGLNAGPATQLNALFARLPEMTNRVMIDQAAVEFGFLNSKIARKKLVKFLSAIPRNRPDLIPYYARLIATLHPFMSEVGSGVVSLLDEEFRFLQRKKSVDLSETRAKNARFWAELTKFGVTPTHAIFHCLKVVLDDFTGPNIDIFCVLLENCGRYLLRREETGPRMAQMLDLFRRKRAAQHFDQRQMLLLDNAYYLCNPPERKVVKQKERSPMELYIRHLIYDRLAKRTLEKVLKLLRKLHWDDKEVVKVLHHAFTKVWRIKFSHIPLLAMLAHDLQPYHLDFTVGVIDAVLENVRVGMEQNIFKHNQRRVATMKYLGELYNYRLINSAVIFDTLWSLVTFGHPEGRPLPGQVSPLDAADDFFRIRLVCTLLDTCGMCFDRGSLRKKLDDFLVFFQMYILCKEPMPMDVDFMVSDTIENLRPNMGLMRTFESAAQAVDDMLASNLQNTAANMNDEGDESEGSDSADETEGGRAGRSDLDQDEEGFSNAEESAEDEEQAITDEEDEHVVLLRERQEAIDKEAEEEFARELAKMMADNSDSRNKTGRAAGGLMDVSIPFVKRLNEGRPKEKDDDAAEAAEDERHMTFSLLSRKGNKHQTRDVQVPIDAAMAVNTRTKQMRDRAEQQQLKQLVLSYESREEASEKKAAFLGNGRGGRGR